MVSGEYEQTSDKTYKLDGRDGEAEHNASCQRFGELSDRMFWNEQNIVSQGHPDSICGWCAYRVLSASRLTLTLTTQSNAHREGHKGGRKTYALLSKSSIDSRGDQLHRRASWLLH